MKNVAALLLALQRQDNKVIGKTTAKRLARDPAPAEVIPLKKEDMRQFKKLAKEYGILYFFAQKKGNESGYINVVSNQNYAAQLNAVMIALGYPIPQQTQEGEPPKKAKAPAPQERSSPERGSGLNPSPMTGPDIEMKESVRARLEGLRAMAESRSREKTRDKTR